LPSFNENGDIERLEMGYPMSVYTELADLVNEEGMPLEQAVKVLTSNIADILKLRQKGRIQIGKDADLVIVDANFTIQHVVAMGKLMVKDGSLLKKGNYEK
jgi:beta-aspartyl-dipeptidase (metallo-type)